jgi:hypothetical protein
MTIIALIGNALASVTFRHTSRPPAAIRMKLDNQYFGEFSARVRDLT